MNTPANLPRLVAFAFLVTPVTFQAQTSIRTRAITKPDAEFAEPFTAISGLRELADGRVLVSDSRDKTLQVLDMTRGTAAPVGRSGAGPGEWVVPTKLIALPGDTTIMSDAGNDRFFVANPDAKPGVSFRVEPDSPLRRGNLIGVDNTGRMLIVIERRAANPSLGTAGVADVLRYDRRTGRVDSLATLNQPKGERTAATMISGGMMRMATNLPLASQDLAGIAPDGRVAIVRASPYRVEWIGVDGRRTIGPTAQAPNVRVTHDEKQAFVRSQIRPGAILVRGPTGAAPPPAAGRAAGGTNAGSVKVSSAQIDAMLNPDMVWPDTKPPFLSGAVYVAADGRVWVQRTRAHDDSIPTFDIFDASGNVVERIALPKRVRVVGFGKGVVYLARTDNDDLVWLQRVRY